MLQRTVMKAKTSFIITIPKQLCGAMGIEKGDILNIEMKDNTIIYAPVEPSKAGTSAASTAEEPA